MSDTDTLTAPTTADVIAGMLTENTGRHMLDSGDHYGRHFERNAGMTAADFEALPTATWGYGGEYAIVNVFHFLTERLEFAPELQAEFDAFAAENPDLHWLGLMELFVEEQYPDAGTATVNTYNHENVLSQDLQYVVVNPEGDDYIYGDDIFVLLQTHNGCDARGGYTAPKAFRVCGEVGLFDDNDVEFSCSGTEPRQVESLPGFPDGETVYHGWSYRGEWISNDGTCCDDPEFKADDDGNVPCPEEGCTGHVTPWATAW